MSKRQRRRKVSRVSSSPRKRRSVPFAERRKLIDTQSRYLDLEKVRGDLYYENELNRMKRAFDSGNAFGAVDAVLFCDETGFRLPAWALRVLAGDLRLKFSGNGMQRRGRHARPLEKYLEAHKDYFRYQVVKECRERKSEIKQIRGCDVFEQARIVLEGTPLEGTRKTIERAYYRFLRNYRKNPYLYYVSRFQLQLPLLSTSNWTPVFSRLPLK
jgi:hypothetical protein